MSESSLRRSAKRAGMALHKKGGTYMLVDESAGWVVAAGNHETGYGLSLADVEDLFRAAGVA